MSDECNVCGQEPPSAFGESLNNALEKAKDKIVFGVSCECSECGMRLNPRDKIEDIEGERTVSEIFRDEQNDETKFLDQESLNHGME